MIWSARSTDTVSAGMALAPGRTGVLEGVPSFGAAGRLRTADSSASTSRRRALMAAADSVSPGSMTPRKSLR